MKTIVTTILLFISWNVFSQSAFKIENQTDLVWDHVYDIDVKPKDLFSFLESSGYFNNVSKTDTTFNANFDRVKPNYKNVGVSETSLPIAYIGGVYAGGLSVKVRDGRYRVRITNMEVKTDVNTLIYSTLHVNYKLSESFVKNGKLKSVFDRKIGPALQNTFNSIFYFKNQNDNW